ncbi:hypothetical protein OAK26_03320, partial [Gammaproteobacteria bacterium]|nr:hypothetical protein [Gammaproteobacteria bacterium]
MTVAKPLPKYFHNRPNLVALQKGVHCVCLTALLFLLPNVSTANQKQLDLERLQLTITELQKNLTTQSEQQTNLEADLKRVETEAGQINASIREFTNNIKIAEKQLASKQKQKSSLKKNIDAQSDAIIEQLRSAQKVGDQEPIKLLLNQEDPQKIARIFKYYDYFLEARSAKIDKYLVNVTALTDIIQSINSNKLELVAAKNTLFANQQNLKTSITQRENTLEKLRLAVADDQQKLTKLQRQRRELEALLNAVEAAVADLVL